MMDDFRALLQALSDTPELYAAGVPPFSPQIAVVLLGGLRELIATAVEDGADIAGITGPAIEATRLLLGPRPAARSAT
jgi:hypothetical protein